LKGTASGHLYSINTNMQNLPIYLYSNTLDVILDLDVTIRGVNQVMYQRDLKIQKGIKNKVRIQFKNSDQKRININNTATYVFSMFDAINQRLLLQKNLDVIDDGSTLNLRGVAELTLTESDTIDLDKSSYQYSVTYQDPTDGTSLPAYVNTYYGMAGTVILNEDIYPTLQPSQEIVSFLKTFDSTRYIHPSGNIYAYPEYNSNSALHTVALYMTQFRGEVIIEGTLSNTPAGFNRYAAIDTKTYSGFSGVDYINFNGIFSYIKITYIPAKKVGDSQNDNPSFFGSFDKALYRC
jgi:hypothetical protein